MTVVIAEDSVLLREGVARLLAEAGFEVVAQSDNADDLLRHVAMHKPDVAIVDIRMPPTHTDEGLVAAARDPRALSRAPACSSSRSTSSPGTRSSCSRTARRASATCSRTGSADVEEFAAAVRRVAEGGSALDPAVVSQLVGRRRARRPARRADAARARGAGADGRGPLQPGDRRAACSSRSGPSRST